MDLSAFTGRRVLVTGHTGFKGAWLYKILDMAGADLDGVALPPNGNFLTELSISKRNRISSEQFFDIRDIKSVEGKIRHFRPDIVFHLAAQPLVRQAYRDPVETFETNVLGTLNVMEAVRRHPSTSALVVVTSDKAYENKEWLWGYRETDRLGGIDPYSASKAAAEIIFSSYKRSLLDGSEVAMVSARAGNVIGGGDWSPDRIIPDAVRSVMEGRPLLLRSPDSTRPWQHVLDPLSGYLLLAQKLIAGDRLSPSYNFGPDVSSPKTVLELVESFFSSLGEGKVEVAHSKSEHHEAKLLQLNCDLAKQELLWQPKWSTDKTVEETSLWYRSFLDEEGVDSVTTRQIEEYLGEEK